MVKLSHDADLKDDILQRVHLLFKLLDSLAFNCLAHLDAFVDVFV